MGKSCLFSALVLLLMIHSSLSLRKCKKHEPEALLDFKQSFTKDPMNLLSSWVGDDCCHWLGVTCDDISGNVIKLSLRNNHQLDYYNKDVDYSLVSSKLSSALLELKLLNHLDLSGNNFSKSHIPKSLGSMTNLRYLNLSNAKFTGQIPSQLGNLPNLIYLDLNNDFRDTGLYTDESLEWAYGLSKLQSLDMSYINMSQTNDTLQVLFRLPSLLSLSLSYCQLHNTDLAKVLIPNNSNNTMPSTLQLLDLSSNDFGGPFPSFLQNMNSLQSLSLVYTGLNESVPLWLKNMRHLEFLDLSSNKFNYVEGGVWGIMGKLCNLKVLDLSQNSIIQEDILEPFVNSTRCDASQLEHLDLSYNKLNGNLSSVLGQLTKLKYLNLSNNMLQVQGPIPESIAKLSALKVLALSNNRLSGLMPDILRNLTKLVLGN